MKRRLFCFMIVFALLCPVLFASGAAASPYAIKVNRAMNTVTVYEMDVEGAYTVPVRAMICSTARSGYTTPLGSYTLKEYRSEWRMMLDGTYAQYATCFWGHYLFHSVCFEEDSHNAMVRDAYNNLGEPASMGCIRLQTADAKWIFDNCPAGTPVTIYDDAEDPGPLGKPEKVVDHITQEQYNGWDPTDPTQGNPWHRIDAETVKITEKRLSVTAGEAQQIPVQVQPQEAWLSWSSSDEAVAKVDETGTVTAMGAGTAQIEAKSVNGISAVCTVKVTGQLLAYDDLQPGAWYYPEVRRALEQGSFRGVGERRFAPQVAMTRAMVVQALYNMEKKKNEVQDVSFADVAQDAWYYEAVAWAASEGVINGVSQDHFAPDRPMSRQELATILWRCAGTPSADGEELKFSDTDKIAGYAREAMAWMVQRGLMQGTNGMLQPAKTATRIETAVLLQRFVQR